MKPSAIELNRSGMDLADWCAVLSGLLVTLEVQVIGRLYIGEVALLGYALVFLWHGRYRAAEYVFLRTFLILACFYFLGLVISDIYRQTAFADWTRGWSRAVFFVTDFLGLVAIGWGKQRRLNYWVIGSILSLWISYLIQSELGVFRWLAGGTELFFWKFGFALPLVLSVLFFLEPRRKHTAYVSLFLLAVLNLIFNYRSMAGICAALGLVLVLKLNYITNQKVLFGLRIAVTIALVTVAMSYLYFSSESQSGGANQDYIGEYRITSNASRLASYYVGYLAISQSPIIGYGSWARNQGLFQEWIYAMSDYGFGIDPSDYFASYADERTRDMIYVHSYLLQAWVEAGIVGLIFFAFLLFHCVRSLFRIVFSPEFPNGFFIVCFYCVSTVWAILMSPFGGPARWQLGLTLALIFYATIGTKRAQQSRVAQSAPS